MTECDPQGTVFSVYQNVKEPAPYGALSLGSLAAMARHPQVGPKQSALALTPFDAKGKTREHATAAGFYGAVIDHDDDNKDTDALTDAYGQWGCAWLAFTSASHQQDKKGVIANRWKVLIPFSQPVDFERYCMLARGLALLMGADPAQARGQQVFFAPNKISDAAPYEYIDETARAFLDPYDESHPLISASMSAYKREQEERDRTAREATPKPREAALNVSDGGIIDKVCQQFDLESELLAAGYQKRGRKFLSPHSTTGTPGVFVFTGADGKERCFSHHGPADPLSNLNYDGHALDVFDVMCSLSYGNDVSRAVRALAPMVDPQAQKQRQRDYRAAQEAEKAAEYAQCEAQAKPELVQPIDIFNTLEPEPFPLHLLPRAIADYAQDQAELTGVDPAVIAIAAIGAAAACIDV